jgi:hypothetical protein
VQVSRIIKKAARELVASLKLIRYVTKTVREERKFPGMNIPPPPRHPFPGQTGA